MSTIAVSSYQSLRIRAQSALHASPIQSLQRLKIEERDAALVISGSVGSYYHKQLAQEAVRSIAGDVDVVNAISVI